MQFCTKRPLKNIMYQLRIVHRCPDKEEWAMKTAEKLWDQNFQELLVSSGKKRTLDAMINKISAHENNANLERVNE